MNPPKPSPGVGGTWRTYTDGVPPGRSLLWLGPDVIGMVIPGETWSTYYLVGDAMQRGTKADDEAAARLIVESKLRTIGVTPRPTLPRRPVGGEG